MPETLGKRRSQLIIALKKKHMFKENGSDIVDVHAGIAINEKIHKIRSCAGDIPEAHKGILRVIKEVEDEERQMREDFRQAGLSEEDIPQPSRALRNLNIQERLAGRKILWRDQNVETLIIDQQNKPGKPRP